MHEKLEEQTGKKFGDPSNPLLVSCRSGAKFSMPGMMDTVLNIGLNDDTAKTMVELTGDARFVYDSYRRLVQMFGSVVMGVPDEPFEEAIAKVKAQRGVRHDVELNAQEWMEITERFKGLIQSFTGREFPQDPYRQLELATRAVFNSWFSKRAVDHRNATNIRHDLGTAVSIRPVKSSATWATTAAPALPSPATPSAAARELYGDYLFNAQGEDVVAGIRNTACPSRS
ncbi:MAG: PEP/pyruvate-binding domain-containing protein [Caldilineaceae bacterium]